MGKVKNPIISVSFRTTSIEEMLLLQWIEDNTNGPGQKKSDFIKRVLYEKFKELENIK